MIVSGASSELALLQNRMLELPTSKIALLGGGEEKSCSSNFRICDSYRVGSGWTCPIIELLLDARNKVVTICNSVDQALACKVRSSLSIISWSENIVSFLN